MDPQKLLHKIGEALGILASATPLIGSDAKKVKDIINGIHSLADDLAATVAAVEESATEPPPAPATPVETAPAPAAETAPAPAADPAT